MTILEDLMYKEYIAAPKSATIEDAIKLMHQNHQGVIIVVDENNFPIGVLTERNILEIIHKNIDHNKLIVDQFSFQTPVTINMRRSIDYALHILIDNGIRRLVVVDNIGTFRGVVTQDVLVKSLEGNSFKIDILISQLLDSARHLVKISQNDTIFNAFDTMTKLRVGSVIAIDENGNAVGILTEKDAVIIANKKISTTLPISTVMSYPVICVKANTTLRNSIDIMTNNKINRLIVLDNDTEKPINIVTMRDVANNLKGNYGQLLEWKLKSIKNTLNFIGEYIVEIYEDKNEQIIQWMNKRAIEKFGNLLDKNINSLIEDDKWNEIHDTISRERKCFKEQIKIKDMHFSIHCSYHFSNKNETLLLVLKDITELTNEIIDEKSKNEELNKELKIVKSVIDQQNNIIFVTDGNELTLVNKPFLDFFDIPTMEDFSKKYKALHDTFISHPNFFSLQEDSQNWVKEINKLYEKDKIVSMIDYKTFEPKVFSVQLIQLESSSNNYIITFTDITEEKLESEKYYFNATHDSLTKIYNKAFFLDSLHISLGNIKRYHSTISLIFFNIDNFRLINEKHGFIHGDAVINTIAKTINQKIRNSDIFARYSSDEFAIILPETNVYKAELLAENLRKIISNLTFDEVEQQTASFGITQILDIDSENTLIRRVAEALRVSKNNGKNKVSTI